MLAIIVYTSVLTCALIFFADRLRRRSHSLPLPPGPKPLPWIGNLFQMPTEDQGKVYARWASRYGDVIYLLILGRDFVILNSAVAALELLDQRGSLYSDRPHLSMAGDLVGRGKFMLFQPYGERLRKFRKHMRDAMNTRSASAHWHLQEVESQRFLGDLLRSPENFIKHIRRNAGAVALKLAYGYTLVEENDHYISIAEDLGRITKESTEPGKWLVDSFPCLKYVPAWFPGAHFQNWARKARERCEEFTNVPFNMVKANMAKGDAELSFTSRALASLEGQIGKQPSDDDEEIIKYAAAGIYAGGTETTVALLSSFFLLMTCFPEVQRKAQQEIDTLTGSRRLPVMSDEACLPYIGCLIKELHRFNPVIPLIPHSLLKDDEYRGFRIPKKSWIMVNTWALMHDSITFLEPEKFKPERFMASDVTQVDPREYSFGFGRRRCPGINLANSFIFLAVSRTLAVFEILRPLDDVGHEYTPLLQFTSGSTSHPKKFSCRIRPRSQEHAALATP